MKMKEIILTIGLILSGVLMVHCRSLCLADPSFDDSRQYQTDYTGKVTGVPIVSEKKPTRKSAPKKVDKPRFTPFTVFDPDKIVKVEVRSAFLGETILHRKGGCYRYKVTNTGTRTIKTLDVTFYFINRGGRVFYEDTDHPVFSSSISEKSPLKPGYSRLDSGCATEREGFDTQEWSEGKIQARITKIEFSKSATINR